MSKNSSFPHILRSPLALTLAMIVGWSKSFQNPQHHQQLMSSSSNHFQNVLNISFKSVHKISSYFANRQTNTNNHNHLHNYFYKLRKTVLYLKWNLVGLLHSFHYYVNHHINTGKKNKSPIYFDLNIWQHDVANVDSGSITWKYVPLVHLLTRNEFKWNNR